MKTTTGDQSPKRRTVLYWLTAAFSGVVMSRFFKGKEKKEEPVKFLAQDGTLVEVDPRFLSKGRKVETEEIKNWVKRSDNNHQ